MTTNNRPSEYYKELQAKSLLYRKTILRLIFSTKAGHTGGSLSCVDLLNVLYNHVMDITPQNFHEINRDHYIHSKGHAVEALYAVLVDQGFFSWDELAMVEKYGSRFIGHPTRDVPGIEQNTGALGHGLAFAVGMALAAKMDCRSSRIFTIMGDGELAEGSVWEASISAAHYKLDNLIAIVDRNTLQISGRTEDVMATEPIDEKFQAFGYAVRHVDGNDIRALVTLFDQIPFETSKPNLILAHTTKGKGVSFIEDKVPWHHKVPSETEFEVALRELGLAEKDLEAIDVRE